jgi:hypothetical protein
MNHAEWAGLREGGGTMTPETFADGIGRIGLTEGMVRIELVSIADQASDGHAAREVRHRIVMTPQGFLQAVQAQLSLVRKLEEAGILRRAPQPSSEAPPPQSNGSPRSPNF